MFARTERLLLRPGWAEDAPALARAIADEQVVRNLATAPWPFALQDAEAFLAAPRDPALPSFLITERTDGAPRIVGACGLGRRPSGAVEMGYWIARPYWGRGFATEASQALIDIGRTLKLPRLEASHFIDCVSHGSEPTTDGEAGLRIVRLLEAASASMSAQGRLVTLEQPV